MLILEAAVSESRQEIQLPEIIRLEYSLLQVS